MSRNIFLRIAFSLLITLVFLLMGISPVQAQAPSNDNFTDATPISTTPYVDQVANMSEATMEEGEPYPTCVGDRSIPRYTVWYAYTPSESEVTQFHISFGYEFFLAVYTGSDLVDLTEISCWADVWDPYLPVQADETYYFQIGNMWSDPGSMHFQLDIIPPPPNDNFTDAIDLTIGSSISVNNAAASVELGEPSPSCGGEDRTVWFRYIPETSGSVTALPGPWWSFVAAYSGNALENLVQIRCQTIGFSMAIRVEAGTTYYFQVGSWYGRGYGEFTFQFYETPLPTADFNWGPWEPSVFDNIFFCDNSWDPANIGFSASWWDFGDGVIIPGGCASHQFATDGDYTVWHNAQTSDGRTDPDGVTKIITVRTDDVAITRVAAPKSASVGQTRQITVYLKNNRYPERVEVQLQKSIVEGYELVGMTNQIIPVRGGNRTTSLTFPYTFTKGDAEMGEVTFRAVVTLLDRRDALPTDNEFISLPTKVNRSPSPF